MKKQERIYILDREREREKSRVQERQRERETDINTVKVSILPSFPSSWEQ